MLDGEYQFPCGCWATDGGPHWGYTIQDDEHTCDGTVLAQERKQQRTEKRNSAIASNLRGTAPLRSPVPFSILKPTNKNRW